MCAHTHTYLLTLELSWTTASSQKVFYILKLSNLILFNQNFTTKRVCLRLFDILPEKKNSLKNIVISQAKLTASPINLKLFLLVCRNHDEEQIFLILLYMNIISSASIQQFLFLLFSFLIQFCLVSKLRSVSFA